MFFDFVWLLVCVVCFCCWFAVVCCVVARFCGLFTVLVFVFVDLHLLILVIRFCLFCLLLLVVMYFAVC